MDESGPCQKSPVVFLGPTMDHWQAARLTPADFKAPAAMGDVTRAVAAGATSIVLIDGVFESGPAVWHKEILMALEAGIPVIGASSMGALRAAELHTLGMFGFGKVFEDFASGMLTDDDEVAVEHGPAETGWIQMSDAMVDIRARVEQAVAAHILSPDEAEQTLHDAKACYFKHRDMRASLERVLAGGRKPEEFVEVLNWFQTNAYSHKRNDCQLLLENMSACLKDATEALRRVKPTPSTIYMKRLAPFGHQPKQKGNP